MFFHEVNFVGFLSNDVVFRLLYVEYNLMVVLVLEYFYVAFSLISFGVVVHESFVFLVNDDVVESLVVKLYVLIRWLVIELLF